MNPTSQQDQQVMARTAAARAVRIDPSCILAPAVRGRRAAIWGSFVCFYLLLTAGCSLWLAAPADNDPVSLLRPIGSGPDSVAIEIFAARFPLGDSQLNGPVWDSIDEQQLPAELRRELATHGIRAGLMSSEMPPEIARVLKLTDDPIEPDALAGEVDVDAAPTVTRRLLNLSSGHTMEYIASGVYPQLSLLLPDGDGLRGTRLEKAQAVLEITPTIRTDDRVDLELLPELQYGEARQAYDLRDGVPRLTMDRPKEAFSQLRLKTAMAPGQILVLTCLPDRPGSLGHHFFTETTVNGKQQKIVLIRLVQRPLEAQFRADKPLGHESAGS